MPLGEPPSSAVFVGEPQVVMGDPLHERAAPEGTRPTWGGQPRLEGLDLATELPPAFVECADNMEFMRKLPTGSMKLIVTSPPYNIGKAYERRNSLAAYIQEQATATAERVRLPHATGYVATRGLSPGIPAWRDRG
jgi:hypothetical protein